MDFDSIIVFLFIFAFFVLPSLIKQIRGRKKKTAASQAIKKNPSIFDRIGEQIKKFVQDLEEQALQKRQGTKEQNTGWEELAEDEELYSDFETIDKDADFGDPSPVVSREKPESEVLEQSVKKNNYIEKTPSIKEPVRPLSERYRLKSNPVQNAIVWSEILTKPVALRKE
ncbi:MAG: hypothetical protein PF503_04710 [Desulfobacula sp.]|jgi:hypothetical protein|nr:hypothetical protein [Desulfobacula sp.]